MDHIPSDRIDEFFGLLAADSPHGTMPEILIWIKIW